MSGEGLLKAQLHLARSVLKSAWSDFYFSTYTWTIVKARDAAWHALAALMRASGVNPSRRWPVSLLLESVSPSCSSMEGLGAGALRLDFLANLYTDPELYLVLWYSSGRETPPRGAALSSLEAALRIVEASEACGAPGRVVDARARAASRLYSASPPGRHTLFTVGSKLYLVSPEFEGVDPVERVERALGYLPLGFTPVLLAPDEAYALLNLPWPLEDYVEIVRDTLGFAPLVKKRSPLEPGKP